MIKMIAAICRRPGMTHAEFLAYLQHAHGKISTAKPLGLRRYIQNHAFDSAFGCLAETTHSMVVSRDSVTELSWDSPEDMKANFADEYVRSKVGPDGKNFSDELCALSLVTSDVERYVAHPAQASGAKVMHFMRAIEGLELNEFFERWEKAHNRVVADNAIVAETVRRCVHHQQLPEFNPMLAYFGAKDMPIYEGVGSLWFDDVSSISAFRVYEKGLMAVNADPDTAFYNPEKSFFVYATEVPIYERHE